MKTFGIWRKKSSYLLKLSKIWLLWKDTLSEPRCLINFLSNMCSWLGASKKTKLLNVCSIISSFSSLKIEKVASYCPATFLAQSLFLQILINVVPLMGKRCRKICRKANILANIDIWARLHLFRIIGPRPKLHITVLLIKGKPGSQKMKKVRGWRNFLGKS